MRRPNRLRRGFSRCVFWLRHSVVDAIFLVRELFDELPSKPRKWGPILDVDPLEKRWLPATFNFANTSVPASESARVVTIAVGVTRGVSETGDLYVNLISHDGSASSADSAAFIGFTENLKFPATSDPLQTVTYDVKITDQAVAHDTQTFTITLSDVRGTLDTATVTIDDRSDPINWTPTPLWKLPDPWQHPWWTMGPFQIDPLTGGVHSSITIDRGFEIPDTIPGRSIDPGIAIYGGGDVRTIDPGYWINQIPLLQPKQPNPYLYGGSTSFGTWRGWDTGNNLYPGIGFDIGQFIPDSGFNINGGGRNIDPGFYPPGAKLPQPYPYGPLQLGPALTPYLPYLPNNYQPQGPMLELQSGSSGFGSSWNPASTTGAPNPYMPGWNNQFPVAQPAPIGGAPIQPGAAILPMPYPTTPYPNNLGPTTLPMPYRPVSPNAPYPYPSGLPFDPSGSWGGVVNPWNSAGTAGIDSNFPSIVWKDPTSSDPFPFPGPASPGKGETLVPVSIFPNIRTTSGMYPNALGRGGILEPMLSGDYFGGGGNTLYGGFSGILPATTSGLPSSAFPSYGAAGTPGTATLFQPNNFDPMAIFGGVGGGFMLLPDRPYGPTQGPVKLPMPYTPRNFDQMLVPTDPASLWDFMRSGGIGDSTASLNRNNTTLPWILPSQPWTPSSLWGGASNMDPGIAIGLGVDPRAIGPSFSGGSSLDPGFYPGFYKPLTNLPQGLVYDSDASSRPTIFANLQSPDSITETTTPEKFQVRLSIDGADGPTEQSWKEFADNAHGSTGAEYNLGQQLDAAVTTAGIYTYTLDIHAQFNGKGDVWRHVVGTIALLPAKPASPFGPGWNFGGVNKIQPLSPTHINPDDDDVAIQFGQGGYRVFIAVGDGTYISPDGDGGQLTRDPISGNYIYTSAQGWTDVYDPSGRLIQRIEPRGTAMEYSYDGDRLSTITTPDGDLTTFNYVDNLIDTIQLPHNRVVTFTMDDGTLVAIKLPDSSTVSYAYEGSINPRLTVQKMGPQDATLTYTGDGVANGFIRGYYDGSSSQTTTIVFTPRDPYATGTTLPVKLAEEPRATIIDALSQTTSYALDSQGLITKLEAPGGSTIGFDYNAAGRVTKVVDPTGFITTFEYDTNHLDVKKIIRGDTGSYVYDYGSTTHRVEKITDPQGNVYTIIYAANGVDIEAVQYPTPGGTKTTTFTWDEGRIGSITDALGQTSTVTYEDGRPKTLLARPGDIFTISYDTVSISGSTGFRRSEIDQLFRINTVTYDPSGRIISQDDGAGLISYSYDEAGRPVGFTDRSGRHIEYDLDPSGFLKRINVDNKGTALAVYTFAYNPAGDVIGKTDLLGGSGSASYAFDRQPIRIIDAGGSTTSFHYDLAKRLDVVTLPDGTKVTFVYDSVGRISSVQTPGGALGSYLYDKIDRPIELAGPDGVLTSYNYAGLNLDKIIRRIDGGNTTTATIVYDDFNRIRTVQPGPKQPTTSIGYDIYNRVDRLIINAGTADARTVSIVYDLGGRIIKIIDPNLGTTSYGYDLRNRPVLYVQDADGTPRTTAINYDFEQIRSITMPDGSTTSYAFDFLDRPTQIIRGWGSTLPQYLTITYDTGSKSYTILPAPGQPYTVTYDNGLMPIRINAPLGLTTSMVYDNRHHLKNIIDPRGTLTSIAYSPRGDISQIIKDANGAAEIGGGFGFDFNRRPGFMLDGTGLSTSVIYDGLNRPTVILRGVGTSHQAFMTIAYDPAGAWSTIKDPLNHVTSIMYDDLGRAFKRIDPNGAITTTMFDRVGRPISIENALQKITSVTYDPFGNVLTRKDPLNLVTSFSYDAANRVIALTDPTGKVTSYTYDAMGGILTITETGGASNRVASFLYDSAHNLIQRVDPILTTSWMYDPLNRVTTMVLAGGTSSAAVYKYNYATDGSWQKFTNPDGFITTTMFDPIGRPTVTKRGIGPSQLWTTTVTYLPGGLIGKLDDSRGGITSYVYDDVARPWKITRGQGLGGTLESTVSYVYDGNSNIVTIYNGKGTATSFAFDLNGRRTLQIEDFGGGKQRTTTTAYDIGGRLLSIKTPDLAVTSYGYDDADRITKLIQGFGSATPHTTSFVLDSGGRVLTIISPNSVSTSYLFDALGRKTQRVDDYGKSLARTTNYYYDAKDQLIGILPPTSAAISLTLDPFGRTTKLVTDPLGKAETQTWLYTADGQLLSFTGSSGVMTSYAYDGLNQPTRIILGANTGHPLTTSIVYDASGLWKKTIDPLGFTTSTIYDALHREIQRIDPNGATWGRTYDALDRITVYTDPFSKTTSLTYDVFGNMLSQTDPLNRVTAYQYDGVNQLIAKIDPLSVATSYGYDVFGNLVTTTEAATNGTLRRTTTFAYDAAGNVLTRIDPLSTTNYAYDNLNRFKSITVGVGTGLIATTAYDYDSSGKWMTITDPLSHVTSTSYDVLGQPTVVTRAFGKSEAWTTTTSYLPGGFIGQIQDPRGATTSYVYDDYGRIKAITEAKGLGGSLERTTAYTYDDNGQVLSITDGGGTVTSYVYNSLGLVTQLIQDAGSGHLNRTTQTSYDLAGRVLSIQAPDSVVTSYGYDVAGQLTVVIVDHGSGNLNLTTTTAYDAVGHVLSIKAPTGVVTSYAYDDLGRTTRLIEDAGDSLQRTTTYFYDAVDHMTARIAPTGAATSYGYDVLGRMTTMVEDSTALQRLTTWKYDAAGNVLFTTDPLAATTSYAYDALDRVTRTIEAYGLSGLERTITFTYAANGLWSAVTRRLDRGDTTVAVTTTTSTVYDALGRTTRIIEDQGKSLERTTSYLYDTSDRVLTVTNPEGTKTSYAYNALGETSRVIEGYGLTSPLLQRTTTYLYDVAGRVLSITAPTSTITSFAYDHLGRTTRVIEAYGLTSPMLQRTTSYAYSIDTSAGMSHLKITDPLGAVTSIGYDRLGRMRTVIEGQDSFNYTTTYTYSDVNRTVAITDARSKTSTSTYDGLDRLIKTADRLNAVTTYTYSDDTTTHQSRVKITDPLNHSTTYIYDLFGRLQSIKAPTGDVTTYLYDLSDRQFGFINPLGYRGTMAYDALDRMVSRTDALNHTTTYGYTVLDQLRTVKDPLNQVTTYSYDALMRLTQLNQPEGVNTTYAYDEGDRRTGMTDGVNHRTTYVYDALGRNTRIIDARNKTVTMTFDAGDHLLTLKDPNNNTTTYVYDIIGRQTKMTDPNGHAATYAYDALSRLVSETDRASRRRDFAYDDEGRLKGEDWYVSGIGMVRQFSYDYDKAGNQTVAGNEGSTSLDPTNSRYDLTYDALNRVSHVSGPWETELTFTYDKVGNRIQVEDDFGGVQINSYDKANRLESREQIVDTLALRLEFEYTARNQISQLTRLWNTTTGGEEPHDWITSSKTQFEYKGNGPVGYISHAIDDTTFLTLTYSYDAAGRLDERTRVGESTTDYDYDASNQVTTDGDLWYTYDSAGNRIEDNYTTYSIGLGNQLSGPGGFSYDGQGNLIEIKTDANMLYEYGYDLRDQLVWETLEDNNTGQMQWRMDYVYDAWGNLISSSKTVYEDNDPVGDPTVVKFLVDGWKVEQDFWGNRSSFVGLENFDVYADLNNSNELLNRRVFGDGVDQVLARFDSDNIRWYFADHQGTIVSTGDAVNDGHSEPVIFSAFGQLIQGAMDDRYGFQGRELDSTTGMYNFRARWYDPATGRFTAQDPMGFDAGDYNLYRFAFNSPTNFRDASGKSIFGDIASLWSESSRQDKQVEEIRAIKERRGDTSPTPEPPSPFKEAAKAAGEGVRDGAVIVGNRLTFGKIDSLSEESKRLIKENGGLYVGSDLAGAVAQKALTTAAIIASGGVLANGAVAGAKAAGVSGEVICAVQTGLAVTGTAGAVNHAVDNGIQVYDGVNNLNDAIRRGDVDGIQRANDQIANGGVGIATDIAGIAGGVRAIKNGSCFAAGTPLRTPEGFQFIEQFKANDLILARSEHAPTSELTTQRVTAVSVRTGPIAEIRVSGILIHCTVEHPFWARERGWVPAGMLLPGDDLLCEDGRWMAIESVRDTGQVTDVYNVTVEDDHTYFVGREEWGFAVWAHNAEGNCAGLGDKNKKPPAKEVDITPNKNARPGSPMDLDDAIAEVGAGGDVFAKSREIAKKIAGAAGDGPPVWDPPHGPGQKPHFHPTIGGDRAPGHVLYD